MTIKKTLVIAIVGAVLTEPILSTVYLLLGGATGDAPDSVDALIFYSHIVGFTLADEILHLSSPADSVCIVISALTEFFIAFWIVLLTVRTITEKMKAEQSAAPLPPAPQTGPSEGAR